MQTNLRALPTMLVFLGLMAILSYSIAQSSSPDYPGQPGLSVVGFGSDPETLATHLMYEMVLLDDAPNTYQLHLSVANTVLVVKPGDGVEALAWDVNANGHLRITITRTQQLVQRFVLIVDGPVDMQLNKYVVTLENGKGLFMDGETYTPQAEVCAVCPGVEPNNTASTATPLTSTLLITDTMQYPDDISDVWHLVDATRSSGVWSITVTSRYSETDPFMFVYARDQQGFYRVAFCDDFDRDACMRGEWEKCGCSVEAPTALGDLYVEIISLSAKSSNCLEYGLTYQRKGSVLYLPLMMN